MTPGGDALLLARADAEALQAMLATALLLACCMPLAYAMARAPRRLQATLVMLVVLPFWTSYVVRSYSWLLVLGQNGVVNKALLGLG